MAARPKGYGFSAEAKRKVESKYDHQVEDEMREWIEAVLGESVFGGRTGIDGVHEVLRSGSVLMRLAKALGSKGKVNESKMAFKQMENIGNFLAFCEDMGVSKVDLFQTVDLYEKQNMASVILGVHALGRKAKAKGMNVPQLGPKEAQANPRDFSNEQLAAGKGIHFA